MSDDLKDKIAFFLKELVREHGLSIKPISIDVDIPKERKFGDWSLNIAMRLKNENRMPPLEIAGILAQGLEKKLETAGLKPKIEKIEVKNPGFINIYLSREALFDLLKTVMRQKADFGRSKMGQNDRVLIEFVSANPTGPLSIAHARQAAVGDTLANLFAFCGFEVLREYYINDEGNQIRNLGLSLWVRYLEKLGRKDLVLPEGGYQGDYLVEYAGSEALARKLNAFTPEQLAAYDASEAVAKVFSEFAADTILEEIKEELLSFGVRFDSWLSQKKNITENLIQEVLTKLKESGYIYEQEGATWFASTKFGDDKDRVLIKSDGQYTYITPDIAYHKIKFERGYSKLINILGPDHHGYINRLKAAVCALGHNRDDLEILIIQLATLFRAGKPVRMSTRAGEYISLKELLEEVGCDAARFFFLLRKCDSHLEFDMELAKKKSLENPVYYIQYAHARISGIRKVLDPVAKDCGCADVDEFYLSADLSNLKEEEELNLIRRLNSFNVVLENCVSHIDPQGLTNYLRELAGDFHSFYNKFRIYTDDKSQWEITKARFYLSECVRLVIAIGLDLAGISAPKEM